MNRTQRRRALYSLSAALALFVVFFAAAWFVNERLIWPIVPGGWLVERLNGIARLPVAVNQALLLVFNVVVWGGLFYAVASVIRARGARSAAR